MRMEFYAFDAREGGIFRMALIYDDPTQRGKSSEHADVVEGRFLVLETDTRVVERVTFCSDDPVFAGEMTITTSLDPVAGGTEVSIVCEEVPSGISAADHEAGMASTLENLARFTEGR